jgi:hypothetical protein
LDGDDGYEEITYPGQTKALKNDLSEEAYRNATIYHVYTCLDPSVLVHLFGYSKEALQEIYSSVQQGVGANGTRD